MSSNEPDLLRKLLHEDPAWESAAPPDGSPAGVAAGRARIVVEPEDADLVPRRPGPQPAARVGPPSGLRRFGPSVWPWPAATPLGQVRNVAVVVLAVIGAIGGLFFTWYQLLTDPLGSAHAYFDAAVRLNAGQLLYPAGADPNVAGTFTDPPLLAVVLRPVVLLGWPAFAAIWEAVVVGSFLLLLRRLGAGTRTWLALGILAVPAGWALAIGQAEVPLTLLLAIGQPWSIALAANLGLFPALAALWWLGRRDGQATGAFIAWAALLVLGQVVLEFRGAQDYLRALGVIATGRTFIDAPAIVEPWIWGALLILGAGVALGLARTKWGWLAAVTLATLAVPRFVPWMLVALLAAVREPEIAGVEDPNAMPFRPVTYGRRG